VAEDLFRFEHLEVWQRAADLAFNAGVVAGELTDRHLYKYGEQLRGAVLSVSNNIAEGSGSSSRNEFRNFLNMARRSAFECASTLLIFKRQNLISNERTTALLDELNQICRMITGLSNSLG
jgi:four helix bundle protein